MMSAVNALPQDILVQYNAASICSLLGLDEDCRNRLEVSLKLNIAAPSTEPNRVGVDDMVADGDLLNVRTLPWFAGMSQAFRWNSLDYLSHKTSDVIGTRY